MQSRQAERARGAYRAGRCACVAGARVLLGRADMERGRQIALRWEQAGVHVNRSGCASAGRCVQVFSARRGAVVL
eukprot:8916942-Lingulodinium_polyedra.AAC.1